MPESEANFFNPNETDEKGRDAVDIAFEEIQIKDEEQDENETEKRE